MVRKRAPGHNDEIELLNLIIFY